MSEKFNKVPVAVQSRGRRNLSATTHLTSDFGRMDVVYNTEVVPGEDVSLKIDAFLRSAMMPAPTFGQIDIDHRAFFVPYRILCNLDKTSESGQFSWDDFITGRSSVAHPYFKLSSILTYLHGKYWDSSSIPESTIIKQRAEVRDTVRVLLELGFPSEYLNLVFVQNAEPTLDDALDRLNPFSLMAYHQIWWDYYRDSQQIEEQNLRSYIPVLSAGLNTSTSVLTARRCCFRKDYFNTAKIYPQSGASTATSNVVYLKYNGSVKVSHAEYNPDNVFDTDGNILNPSIGQEFVTNPLGIPVQWLRAANSLQKYLERNNLAGTRLMERFLARFGVSPSYVALNMAEYLGGSRSSLAIGDVTANNEDSGFTSISPTNAFNTANDNGSTNGTLQGQLGGKSVADNSTGTINFHAKEFGVIMVIQTIVPKVGYHQGLRRQLFRGVNNDRFDYYTPEMENLGYQQVFNRELYFANQRGNAANGRFGFQPRYSDYKYQPDVCAGDLVMTGTRAGMDSFHLFREFSVPLTGAIPLYGFSEISLEARHDLDRIFSIRGELGQFDHYTGRVHVECHVNSPMSNSALPSLDEDMHPDGNKVDIANGGVRF